MKTLLLAILFIMPGLFAQNFRYSLVDLGTGIGDAPAATDINNQGQVVGFNFASPLNAFIWEDDIITIIDPSAIAVAMNDSGWVLVISAVSGWMYLWRDGATIDLTPLPSNKTLSDTPEFWFLDVNNQNNVVVTLRDTVTDLDEGYLWQGGSWTRLAKPVGFDNTLTTEITDNNIISGFYWESNEVMSRPLYWQNGNAISFSFEGFTMAVTNDTVLAGSYGTFEPGTYESPANYQGFQGGWRWDEGILDTIFTQASATDINEAGSIIGVPTSLYKDGKIYDIESLLDPSGNGYENFAFFLINDLDDILGIAYTGGMQRAVVLRQKSINITSPTADELWIAGEQDTIRWSSNNIDFAKLEYSIDDGNSYELLFSSLPASAGELAWNIPESLMSRKCKIRITDNSFPSFNVESDSFKIKGYYLTRVTPSGDYEKFIPNQDGWQFGNNAASVWPQTWWQQFNYSGIDPISSLPYGVQFNGILNSSHPDWLLWVQTFGIGQCYWLVSGVYKTNSVMKWRSFIDPWGGSCYGFAASSFLGFNYKTEFLSKHPGIPNYSNLFDLAIADSTRKAVNHYYVHQQGKTPLQNDVASWNKTPWTTLQEVKQMFLDENKDIKTITLINMKPGGGGHTVSPYKVEKESSAPGRYRIYVYDSNDPGSDASFVVVDSIFNVWVDSMGLGWAGLTGLYLEPLVSKFLPQPVLPGGDNPLLNLRGDPLTEFYASYNSEYLITTLSGDSVGYLGDSVVFNLEDGIAMIPKTGMPHPPIGYYIPLDEYFIYMNDFTDSSAYLTVFGDVTYDYQRSDATSNQTDRFYYNGNFSVSSDDAEIKNIELSTVVERDSTEKTIYLENTTISQSDSLDMSIQDYDKLTYKNYGSAKSYDLRSIYAMPGSGAFFFHMDITLTANTSHQIAPDWTDLANTPVTIYVDVGIDGTIDDTLQVKNQITNVEGQGNLYIPKEYKLDQNYPNPFNPTTTIKYSLPQESFVTLTIYNLLGEEITTLVNEEKTIGNYEIEFNASALPSGVYLYRIQAGDFVETKKMILLK